MCMCSEICSRSIRSVCTFSLFLAQGRKSVQMCQQLSTHEIITPCIMFTEYVTGRPTQTRIVASSEPVIHLLRTLFHKTQVMSPSWPCSVFTSLILVPTVENFLMYTILSEDAYANSFLQQIEELVWGRRMHKFIAGSL